MTTDVAPDGPAHRNLFGQPFAWLILAIVLAMVPFAGWLSQTGWAWTRIHPAVNAMLTGSAAIFLVAGGLAIRKRMLEFHRLCMLGAFTANGWPRSPYFVLVSGLASRPRVRVDGVDMAPGDDFRYAEGEGRLELRVRGKPRVEIELR